MDLSLQKISLLKLNGFIVKRTNTEKCDKNLVLSLSADIMQFGYILSKELYNELCELDEARIIYFHTTSINVLKKIKGSDVEYHPMYPNFPKQVMDASYTELYINALLHYWTFGEWTPEYKKISREFKYENIKFKEIKLIEIEEFKNIFTTILSSNESISKLDKDIIEWFLDNKDIINTKYPDLIPFKENLCLIVSKYINDPEMVKMLKTPTDILRVVTYLSEGDISLAENTKFKSLPRKIRRIIVYRLEKILSKQRMPEEDIKRHENKWNKLFHNLHVGEYFNNCICIKNIVQKNRNNKTLVSTNTGIEKYLKENEILNLIKTLKTRPGEFARRLDHLLRKYDYKDNSEDIQLQIINDFFSVMDKISTKVLLQLLGHFKNRDPNKERIIFPKGNTQQVFILPKTYLEIDSKIIMILVSELINELKRRFSKLESLGDKVYLDTRLKKCPLPTQQRSSSKSMDIVARGTKIPLINKNTLRFFIYWVGQDIDLSASLHDENFKMKRQISYTNLKDETINCCHSGDITQARNGATEFIDIDIDKSYENGIRYLIMNVFVYNGPTFKEHEKCYAGWMMRDFPDSNEIYDPKTVEYKIDLETNSKNAIPVIFDLKTKEAIWADLATNTNLGRGGNNLHSNKASIEQVLESVVNMKKLSLYDLFELHSLSRSKEIVKDKKEADFTFDLFEGDITPKNINEINSEFIK